MKIETEKTGERVATEELVRELVRNDALLSDHAQRNNETIRRNYSVWGYP